MCIFCEKKWNVTPHPASETFFKFHEICTGWLDSSRRGTLKTGLRIEIDPLLVETINFEAVSYTHLTLPTKA